MKATEQLGHDHVRTTLTGRSAWLVMIVASGTCISPFFACVTPFAALATLAALKLDQRGAFTAIGLVWLMNQMIGYGLLDYPWTWDSLAWGLAIGVSSGLAVLAARALSTQHPVSAAVSLPFVAAFAVFELGLYVAGFVLPTGGGAFSASVIGLIFLTNAVALWGMAAVYQTVALLGLFVRSSRQEALTARGVS